jgi:hypothetical protein
MQNDVQAETAIMKSCQILGEMNIPLNHFTVATKSVEFLLEDKNCYNKLERINNQIALMIKDKKIVFTNNLPEHWELV